MVRKHFEFGGCGWSFSAYKGDLVHFKIGFIIKRGINFKISTNVLNSDYVMQLLKCDFQNGVFAE